MADDVLTIFARALGQFRIGSSAVLGLGQVLSESDRKKMAHAALVALAEAGYVVEKRRVETPIQRAERWPQAVLAALPAPPGEKL